MTLSVVVITYKRPEFLRRCLDSLAQLRVPASEVLVVDQSPDDQSRVVAEQAGVRWLDNKANAGNMTSSRNVGLQVATGDLVAFIDDDVEVDPGWSAALAEVFGDLPEVGGATGLTLNDGQAHDWCAAVGSVDGSGRLVGHFDCTAVTARQPVSHLLGANMTFRRSALITMGGFDEDWPGTAMAEDTDVALRVRRAGWSLVFDPAVRVVHYGAPHVRGQRFDLRYHFYARRNYTRLLLRHRSLLGVGVVTYLLGAWAEDVASGRRTASRLVRLAASTGGVATGLLAAASKGELRGAPIARAQRD